MARYIFITGGVVSSLGKGLMAASLAALLQARGYKVRIRKFDPYLNVDPGTMSPYQHGEVFVTDDGAETDLARQGLQPVGLLQPGDLGPQRRELFVGHFLRRHRCRRCISVQKLDQADSKEYSSCACKTLDELLKVLIARLVVHGETAS